MGDARVHENRIEGLAGQRGRVPGADVDPRRRGQIPARVRGERLVHLERDDPSARAGAVRHQGGVVAGAASHV